MATAIVEQRTWLAEISDLRRASWLLQWDKNTMMPRLGAAVRSEQLATLERVTHERFVSHRTLELIEAAEAERQGQPADSIDGTDRR